MLPHMHVQRIRVFLSHAYLHVCFLTRAHVHHREKENQECHGVCGTNLLLVYYCVLLAATETVHYISHYLLALKLTDAHYI